MPPSIDRLNAVLSDYDSALNTLLAVLDHIRDSSPSPSLRIVLLNSSIVSLTSMIEEAMRGHFQEYLKILQETYTDFRFLRVELQRTNMKAALGELKKINIPSESRTIALAAANMMACFDGKEGYALCIEALTYNQGGFRSQQITDMAKECGLKNILQPESVTSVLC